MTEETESNLLESVKEFLKIEGDYGAAQLFGLIRKFLPEVHPDKFTDEEAKKSAEKRFKEGNELREKLFRFLQSERAEQSSTEVTLYKPIFDNAYLQNELDLANTNLAKANEQISELERENDLLRIELSKAKDDSLRKERERLESVYRFSPQRAVSLGVILALTIVGSVISRVERIAGVVRAYSPVSEGVFDAILFGVFVLLLGYTVKRVVESALMKRRIQEVCSPKHAEEFLKYLEALPDRDFHIRLNKAFTENEAFNYIYGKKTRWKKTLEILGFSLYQVGTADVLKDYFLKNLMVKELIEISSADALDRQFKIKSRV